MNQLDLHGLHGVITGGATGLGFAIAQRMLASGASVTLWDRDPQALERACKSLGGGARGVLVDVADYSQVEAALAQTLQATSQIDMLVNSAGITGPNTTLWDYPVTEWERVMQVNLNGVFHVCKAVVPVMRSQDYGRIVNISSGAGLGISLGLESAKQPVPQHQHAAVVLVQVAVIDGVVHPVVGR